MANINKNIIMQAGAAVANATNKAAGLTAATPEPGAIISAIQLVNGGRTIGPDALAHFTESVRNKLLSLLVSMEPIQDFNGYGHPWPAGGGKNMCPPDIEQGSFDQQGLNTGSTDTTYPIRVRTHGYIPVNSGETIVVSAKGGAAYYAVSGYAVDDYTTPRIESTAWIALGNSCIINEGVNYIRITFRKENTSATITPAEISDVMCEYGSTPTDFAPYENLCPISGRTGLHVYAGPTSAIGDAATYSMAWTSPAGTVYAGSADIVSGDIKAAPYYASYNGETLVGPWVSSMDVYDPEGTPTTGAQVVDLGGTMTEYHITGQDIITLVGDNYIWSDSGDVTITE